MTAVTPGNGPTAGGTLVTIHGTGFALRAGATIVDFGRYTGLKMHCRSHTVCTARAPAHPRGQAVVTVTADGLTSARTRQTRFTYRRRHQPLAVEVLPVELGVGRF